MTLNVKITLSTRDVSRVLAWCGRVNTTEHSEIKCAILLNVNFTKYDLKMSDFGNKEFDY